jgi:hypothetical protein
MNYWLNLFTAKTWEEFRTHGANVSGFAEGRRAAAEQVQVGDILICYLTGVSRWVGALRVLGRSQKTDAIWQDDEFPVRFDVEPLFLLSPEHGVPMSQLEGKTSFFATPAERGMYRGFIRMTLRRFPSNEDGETVFNLIKDASNSPVSRAIDPKKLAYTPVFIAERRKGKQTVQTVVTVPQEIPKESENVSEPGTSTRHSEVQWTLLSLGAEMGFDVWVARNDRSRSWNGQTFGSMPRSQIEIPTQFNEATNRTIELIDVLWLKGNSIVAAFEIECTTSVYSGLLRMSDLLALQPNLAINLYLLAPESRREKVQQEILRPTFSLREKPLAEICGFISFEKFLEKVEGIRRLGLANSLKPDFVEKSAEYFKTSK